MVELINVDTQSWNHKSLRLALTPQSIIQVIQTLICWCDPHDQLFWPHLRILHTLLNLIVCVLRKWLVVVILIPLPPIPILYLIGRPCGILMSQRELNSSFEKLLIMPYPPRPTFSKDNFCHVCCLESETIEHMIFLFPRTNPHLFGFQCVVGFSFWVSHCI